MKAIAFDKIREGDEIIVCTSEDGALGTTTGIVTRVRHYPRQSFNEEGSEITLNSSWSMGLIEGKDVVVRVNRSRK